jgi:hypothetical protein
MKHRGVGGQDPTRTFFVDEGKRVRLASLLCCTVFANLSTRMFFVAKVSESVVLYSIC